MYLNRTNAVQCPEYSLQPYTVRTLSVTKSIDPRDAIMANCVRNLVPLCQHFHFLSETIFNPLGGETKGLLLCSLYSCSVCKGVHG